MSASAHIASTVELRPATAQDWSTIRALLAANNLPIADLADSRPELVVAEHDSTLIGVAGLQRFGDIALLRSLAVAERSRGAGVGNALVREVERLARAHGVRCLVLLTETAATFFASCGYRHTDRAGLPPAILATAEFRSLCPASAACMSKRLDDTQDRT